MDFFQLKKGWKIFWSYFNALPGYSKTKAKIASDPELAEMMTANIDPESLLEPETKKAEPAEVPLEGYDATMAKLDQLIEEVRLFSLTVQSMVSEKGKNKIKFNPQPRPKTEFQKRLEQLKNKAGEDDSKDLMRQAGF